MPFTASFLFHFQYILGSIGWTKQIISNKIKHEPENCEKIT